MKKYQKYQSSMHFQKYVKPSIVSLPDRTWPSNTIDEAPYWCSVDLRDGNQALIEPMSIAEKLKMFDLLVKVGFKEIEIGFPAASKIDFDFTRRLVEEQLIPDDVHIQVLSQARPEQIECTFEAIQGAKNVIYHLYNSTSPTQRRVVFNKSKKEVIELAVDATKLIKTYTERTHDGSTSLTLQYSPESFTATETDFAVDICCAVMDVWQPTTEDKVILNLPATVEVASVNTYADQVEWFTRHLPNRDAVIISLHCHNDRGGAVAASELGMMAGADRVEGTLFGNGERTGNADLITLAMNLFSHGVDPGLELGQMSEIRAIAEECNKIAVPVRHPYAGDLVFTAFSGSHQDAIKKGLAAIVSTGASVWDVPYLPIDPNDVGASYKEVIRINSQSGKGGVAYILENEYGIAIPREVLLEFRQVIQRISEFDGGEITPDYIVNTFHKEYAKNTPHNVLNVQVQSKTEGDVQVEFVARIFGQEVMFNGVGVGPLDVIVSCLAKHLSCELDICMYKEHALGRGKDTQAFCIVGLEYEDKHYYGIGTNPDTLSASYEAIFAALNRMPIKQ